MPEKTVEMSVCLAVLCGLFTAVEQTDLCSIALPLLPLETLRAPIPAGKF